MWRGQVFRRFLCDKAKVGYWNMRQNSTHGSALSGHLKISDEVAKALQKKKPVVALESTIITHGMPYPANIETARNVEAAVRATGSIPATVGILDGRVHVGMDQSELELLAKSEQVVKTSRRDLPMVIGQRLCGGTTVSGTMIAAHAAGIPVFVTGGIGGVHRGAETTMDISADLTELGRTPIAVVCAGVKSILDIGRTLEYLETQGVPVIKYGSDRSMPAFFTPASQYQTPYNVQTPSEAARCIAAAHDLDLRSGMVIAVPIPAELAASGAAIESAIQTAIQEASEKKILGKHVTPYILQRVNELTKGESLQANIGLILNNAHIGGQIAMALSEIRRNPGHGGGGSGRRQTHKLGDVSSTNQKAENYVVKETGFPSTNSAVDRRPVVIGGSILDFLVKLGTDKYDLNGATYPGGVRQLYGGVGRNLADCLSRLEMAPLFISAVGADGQAKILMDFCKDHMDITGVRCLDDASTATYVATIEQNGQIMLGVGDMDIHGGITPELVSEFECEVREASFVCMDGNIPPSTIEYVTKLCNEEKIPVLYEPTDIYKANKIWTGGDVTYSSPNLGELLAMYDALTGARTLDDLRALSKSPLDKVLAYITEICATIVERVPNLLVTLGPNGLFVCRRAKSIDQKFPTRGERMAEMGGSNVVAVHYPNQVDVPLLSVSGAGDCLVSAIVHSILNNHSPDIACKAGLKCAHHSLASYYTVPPDVRPEQYGPEAVLEWADMEGHKVDMSSGGGKNVKITG